MTYYIICLHTITYYNNYIACQERNLQHCIRYEPTMSYVPLTLTFWTKTRMRQLEKNELKDYALLLFQLCVRIRNLVMACINAYSDTHIKAYNIPSCLESASLLRLAKSRNGKKCLQFRD